MSVKFGSATGERPVTLSETTREMCAKALDGFFGRRILETPFVKADDIPGFENMSMREKYAAALDRIVEECPVYKRRRAYSGKRILGRCHPAGGAGEI